MNPTSINNAPAKLINKNTVSPIILVKTNNKSPNNQSDSDDIWHSVDTNKRIRSPLTKSPPSKKVDSSIFITKYRFALISPPTENEPMDSTNDQPSNNSAEINSNNKILPLQ